MDKGQKFLGMLAAMVGEEDLAAMVAKQQPHYDGMEWLKAMNKLYWIQWQADESKNKEQGR